MSNEEVDEKSGENEENPFLFLGEMLGGASAENEPLRKIGVIGDI